MKPSEHVHEKGGFCEVGYSVNVFEPTKNFLAIINCSNILDSYVQYMYNYLKELRK